MPVEMAMWRIDGEQPRRLGSAVMPTESTLEEYLELDPSLLGTALLVIGRQVRTPHGKIIDLLGVDAEGNLHVLELKRDKTPRDAVAQVLDYGSWVSTLTREDVISRANDYLDDPFEEAFEETFGSAPPDDLNTDLELTLVATGLDDSSERIVRYLRDFGVPINVVFFAYLEDDGRRYLARSWLAEPDEAVPAAQTKKSKRAEWNGRDWFVSFGDGLGRAWEDGRVSAGGDAWYSRTLRSLPVGSRVNVHLPGRGYVAIGETLRPAARVDEAEVLIGGSWTALGDQDLHARYAHTDAPHPTDDEAEWVIPVRWIDSRAKSAAFWTKGMFANQNSACKLRQEFTLDHLARHFTLGEDT
jgi:hypothetical protein